MKNRYKNLLLIALFGVIITSCVTGNNDNAVLREHEEALAKTPQVLDLLINGQAKTRDQLSNWEDIIVNPGDQVTISAIISTGNGASSSSFFMTRYYYHTNTSFADASNYDQDIIDDPSIIDLAPLLSGSNAEQTYGAGSTDFSFTYDVPTVDDEGFMFESGAHINISFWSLNDTGGAGWIDFNLIYE